MELIKLLLSESLVQEARKPDLAYNEKRVKDQLSKVTVTLSGSDSAVLSRLAKRYERLEKAMKLMKVERDELNERIKDDVAGLFDAEDAVATRIAETASFTLQLAKEIQSTESTSKKDYESIALELIKLIPEELQAKVNEITEMYTTITPPSAPARKLSVKVNEGQLDEGIITTIKAALRAVATKVKQYTRWSSGYDSKLQDLKTKFTEIKKQKK